jgi:hypothetical protein
MESALGLRGTTFRSAANAHDAHMNSIRMQIARFMTLTLELSGGVAVRLERDVRPHRVEIRE